MPRRYASIFNYKYLYCAPVTTNFLQVHKGIRGKVIEKGKGVPIKDAAIIIGNNAPLVRVYSNKFGDYYRLLLPGTHLVTVSHDEYMPQNRTIVVTADKPYASSNVLKDFELERKP